VTEVMPATPESKTDTQDAKIFVRRCPATATGSSKRLDGNEA